MNISYVLVDVGGTLIRNDPDSLNLKAIPIEGAVDVIERLSRQYQLAIVSNIPEELNKTIDVTLSEAGFRLDWFKAIVSSKDPNVKEKPDPSMFTLAMKKMKATLNETVMVGDTIETDILGAINVGIRSVFVDHSGVYKSSNSTKPDIVINKIQELPKALEIIQNYRR